MLLARKDYANVNLGKNTRAHTRYALGTHTPTQQGNTLDLPLTDRDSVRGVSVLLCTDRVGYVSKRSHTTRLECSSPLDAAFHPLVIRRVHGRCVFDAFEIVLRL